MADDQTTNKPGEDAATRVTRGRRQAVEVTPPDDLPEVPDLDEGRTAADAVAEAAASDTAAPERKLTAQERGALLAAQIEEINRNGPGLTTDEPESNVVNLQGKPQPNAPVQSSNPDVMAAIAAADAGTLDNPFMKSNGAAGTAPPDTAMPGGAKGLSGMNIDPGVIDEIQKAIDEATKAGDETDDEGLKYIHATRVANLIALKRSYEERLAEFQREESLVQTQAHASRADENNTGQRGATTGFGVIMSRLLSGNNQQAAQAAERLQEIARRQSNARQSARSSLSAMEAAYARVISHRNAARERYEAAAAVTDEAVAKFYETPEGGDLRAAVRTAASSLGDGVTDMDIASQISGWEPVKPRHRHTIDVLKDRFASAMWKGGVHVEELRGSAAVANKHMKEARKSIKGVKDDLEFLTRNGADFTSDPDKSRAIRKWLENAAAPVTNRFNPASPDQIAREHAKVLEDMRRMMEAINSLFAKLARMFTRGFRPSLAAEGNDVDSRQAEQGPAPAAS